MLPFNAILPALNGMTAIPSASIGDEIVKCTSGNLFKMTFGGVPFAICAAGRSGFMAFSSDFSVNVEYLEFPVQVEVPALSGGLSCNVIGTATSMTPTAVALLTGSAVPASTTRHLKTAAILKMASSSCKCKSEPRPCVVFHGSGGTKELEDLQDTPKDVARMGNINDNAPCCSEVKYAILNTMDYSWLDKKLQHKFCDRALRVSKTSDKEERVIKDTVVVTHSMGGLTLALAIATGKCSLGEGTSWVALSTPMMGSMVSDFAQDYCDNKDYAFSPGQVLRLIGQCPLVASRRDIAYQNERHASKTINKAYVKAQKAYAKNVFAAMCSDNPNGVVSQYEAIMLFTASVALHKSPQNDGLVEFQSCAKGLNEFKFGKSYKSKFYRPSLNHADTAFLTHDARWNDSQKPRKWFECLL
ncbi:unnamed protein product [Peronospora destructor]|uniref:GPI inositol-deacylase n=1 Tax=Peronospora destructor TaxID=86335 RepID=A0AAV0UJZ4_9STRA|nr:unnamed protein product [Peronospora destructor]